MSLEDREMAERLRTAVRTLVRRFSISERADVACCGVTVAQAATLEALGCCGPTRLSDLSSRLGIAPSTLTRNLKRLEAAGSVEKVPDPRDARASRVRLTAAGRAAAAEVERQEQGFAMDILRRLPEERRKAVAESLELLLDAVRGATQSCCGPAFEHLTAANSGSGRQPGGRSSPAPTGAT